MVTVRLLDRVFTWHSISHMRDNFMPNFVMTILLSRYLIDAFSDGLRLLKLGQVGKQTLEAYQHEIEYGVKNVGLITFLRENFASSLL